MKSPLSDIRKKGFEVSVAASGHMVESSKDAVAFRRYGVDVANGLRPLPVLKLLRSCSRFVSKMDALRGRADVRNPAEKQAMQALGDRRSRGAAI